MKDETSTMQGASSVTDAVSVASRFVEQLKKLPLTRTVFGISVSAILCGCPSTDAAPTPNGSKPSGKGAGSSSSYVTAGSSLSGSHSGSGSGQAGGSASGTDGGASVSGPSSAKCSMFSEDDRQHCRATCDSEYNNKTKDLDDRLFNCARTRDIERSGLHEQECHEQCDRDHDPGKFDEGACHQACDRTVEDCHKKCGNDACNGWCDTDVKHGCNASCSGRKNQIVADRAGCNASCSGRGNAITEKYNGCKASVDGTRNQAEADQKGCYKGCDGQYNASQDCLKKGNSQKPIHLCYCEKRDLKHPQEGTGETFTVRVETCTGVNVCLGACGGSLSRGCN